jgi:hypothetical protein
MSMVFRGMAAEVLSRPLLLHRLLAEFRGFWPLLLRVRIFVVFYNEAFSVFNGLSSLFLSFALW